MEHKKYELKGLISIKLFMLILYLSALMTLILLLTPQAIAFWIMLRLVLIQIEPSVGNGIPWSTPQTETMSGSSIIIQLSCQPRVSRFATSWVHSFWSQMMQD